MRILSSVSLAALMTGTLAFGACGGKDKAVSVTIPSASSMMTDLKSVPERTVSDSDGKAALAAMGLDTSGQLLSWGGMSGSDGNYTFSDVSLPANSGKAATMTFKGLRQENGVPAFDLMTMSDITMSDRDMRGSIKEIGLSGASAVAGEWFVDMMSGRADEPAFLLDPDAVGGFYIDDMDVTLDDDVSLKIDDIVVDMNDGEGKAQFSFADIKMKPLNEEGNFSLAKFEATGIDVGAVADLMDTLDRGGEEEVMMSMMAMSMNPSNAPYRGLNIENVNFSAEGVTGSLEQMVASVTQSGDVTKTVSSMKPMRFAVDENAPRDMREMSSAMAAMGYDEIVLTGGSTTEYNAKTKTLTVPEYFYAMEDGFRFDMDFGLTDVGNMSMMNGQRDMMDIFENVKLNNAKISFADKGILDRGLKYTADMQNSSVATVKSQMKSGLAMSGMMAQNDSQRKVLAQLSKAATKFIDSGGTFVLSMDPDSPMTMENIFDLGPNTDFSTMNISIKTK